MTVPEAPPGAMGIGCAPLEAIIRGRPMLDMDQGSRLFRRGEAAERAFVLVEGQAALYLETPTGGKSVIHVVGAGECIGLAAVLCFKAHPVSAETVVASRFVVLPAADVQDWLRTEPVSGPRLIALIAQRYGQLLDTLVEYKVLPPRTRLCHHLFRMAEQAGAPREGAYGFPVPLPAHVLGRMVGLVPESTSRALAYLAVEGIRLRGGWVYVDDMRTLRRLAAGPSGRTSGCQGHSPNGTRE